MKVKLENGESAESLIRRFMKKIKKSGLMEELQERRTYKKPSEISKEKKRRRERTLQKLKEEHKVE